MTKHEPNPLRLQPPQRTADQALGERLAVLARASTPAPRRRRTAWRAPLAGLAIVAGTGGLAYGAQSAVHHFTEPTVITPGDQLTPSASTDTSSPAAGDRPPARSAPATDLPSASVLPHPGKHLGTEHGKAQPTPPGHGGNNPGKHLGNGKSRGASSGQGKKTGQSTNGQSTSSQSTNAHTGKHQLGSSVGSGKGRAQGG